MNYSLHKIYHLRFFIGLVYYGVSLAAVSLTGNPYRDFMLIGIVDFPASATAMLIASR